MPKTQKWAKSELHVVASRSLTYAIYVEPVPGHQSITNNNMKKTVAKLHRYIIQRAQFDQDEGKDKHLFHRIEVPWWGFFFIITVDDRFGYTLQSTRHRKFLRWRPSWSLSRTMSLHSSWIQQHNQSSDACRLCRKGRKARQDLLLHLDAAWHTYTFEEVKMLQNPFRLHHQHPAIC